MGEDLDEDFLKDLVENYEGGVHGFGKDYFLSDELFFELVCSLYAEFKPTANPTNAVNVTLASGRSCKYI